MDWNNRAYGIVPFKEGSHLCEVLETLTQLVAEKQNLALANFSSDEVIEFKRLLLKLTGIERAAA
jgi:hypothetical protein